MNEEDIKELAWWREFAQRVVKDSSMPRVGSSMTCMHYRVTDALEGIDSPVTWTCKGEFAQKMSMPIDTCYCGRHKNRHYW